MSQNFFESLSCDDFSEILKILKADKLPICFISKELLVLKQTKNAENILGTGIFESVRGILSSESCSAIKLCIDNNVSQTISEILDGCHYSIKINSTKNGAFLYFSRLDDMKNSAMLFSTEQNKIMRDYLTLILMALSNMHRQPLDDKGRAYVGIIKQNSLRLLRSLEHATALRSPFYQNEMNFGKGDIAELLNEIKEEICKIYPSSECPICLECPESLPAVFDPAQIAIALYNLISNALKFGGDDVKIMLKAELRSNTVYLSVSDNGPGIKEDEINHSCEDFNFFDNTDENFDEFLNGSKLGIPLCRKIASCHSGVLFIGTGKKNGTTVTLAFPSNLPADESLNQSNPTFTSNGFKASDIELSTFLSYEHYKK